MLNSMASRIMNMVKKISNNSNTVRISNGSVTINGQRIDGDLVCGDMNFTSSSNKIMINGREIFTSDDKVIHVVIEGNAPGSISTQSGNIYVVGNVSDNVETMSGDVEVAGTVTGRVETMSGNVTATTINGRVESMSGNIRKG